LPKRLAEIKRGEIVQFIAEIDGEVVGNAEVRRHVGRQSHVGTMGIVVKFDSRRIGIGTRLIEKLLSEGKKQGLKIVTLQVNETNLPAITLYRKLGFNETGRIPKAIHWNGK
jgi:ribosomal protein S18 acetylase RimI-like enzyme